VAVYFTPSLLELLNEAQLSKTLYISCEREQSEHLQREQANSTIHTCSALPTRLSCQQKLETMSTQKTMIGGPSGYVLCRDQAVHNAVTVRYDEGQVVAGLDCYMVVNLLPLVEDLSARSNNAISFHIFETSRLIYARQADNRQVFRNCTYGGLYYQSFSSFCPTR